jgi:hypothetical protein
MLKRKSIMSDSLFKPRLGIGKLSTESLRKVFGELHGVVDTKGGVPTNVRPNYKSIRLPLGGNGRLILKGLFANGATELPTHLEFKNFHAPNALTEQNLVHGTSVSASIAACLWAFKMWLARIGVTPVEIDGLTKADIELEGVDVTYLREHETQAEAARYVSLFGKVAAASGRTVSSHSSTNVTCDVGFNEITLTSYNKTDLKHCKLPKNMIGDQIRELGLRLSRIEVKLRRKKLVELGLSNGLAWESAYEDDLYRTIYEQHVSAAIQAAKITRQKKPYPEAIQAAVESMRPERKKDAVALLNWYFDGKDVNQFVNSEGFPLMAGQIRSLRNEFLKHLEIDTSVVWAASVFIGMSGANKLLEYPGDYKPLGTLARGSFCEESWPQLLDKLKGAYSAILKPSIDPSSGAILNW